MSAGGGKGLNKSIIEAGESNNNKTIEIGWEIIHENGGEQPMIGRDVAASNQSRVWANSPHSSNNSTMKK